MEESIARLNVFFQFLTGITALFAYLMQILWNDKRTKKYQSARNFFIGLTILLLCLGIVVTVNENMDNNLAKLELQHNFNSIKLNFDSVKIEVINSKQLLNESQSKAEYQADQIEFLKKLVTDY